MFHFKEEVIKMSRLRKLLIGVLALAGLGFAGAVVTPGALFGDMDPADWCQQVLDPNCTEHCYYECDITKECQFENCCGCG